MSITRPSLKTVNDPKQLLDWMDAVTQVVNRSDRITVGPGLAILKTAGSVGISVKRSHAAAAQGKAPSGWPCDVISLAATQGQQDTDDWNRDGTITAGGTLTDRGVSMSVVTDWEYDLVTRQLGYRTRTLVFDKRGALKSVSAESELIVATTAEVCSA